MLLEKVDNNIKLINDELIDWATDFHSRYQGQWFEVKNLLYQEYMKNPGIFNNEPKLLILRIGVKVMGKLEKGSFLHQELDSKLIHLSGQISIPNPFFKDSCKVHRMFEKYALQSTTDLATLEEMRNMFNFLYFSSEDNQDSKRYYEILFAGYLNNIDDPYGMAGFINEVMKYKSDLMPYMVIKMTDFNKVRKIKKSKRLRHEMIHHPFIFILSIFETFMGPILIMLIILFIWLDWDRLVLIIKQLF